MGKKYTVAVVGATGAVGTKMLELLQEVNLPIERVKALASKRSAGKTLAFKDQVLTIEELTADSFEGVDIALFSAGGGISEIFAPEAVKRGAVVIDNTSHFRMVPGIPLVVPEVNPESLKTHQGIIANPNCSTAQLVVALKPLHDKFKIKRVVTSTYQSVSGAGKAAMDELISQTKDYLNNKKIKPKKFTKQILKNN